MATVEEFFDLDFPRAAKRDFTVTSKWVEGTEPRTATTPVYQLIDDHSVSIAYYLAQCPGPEMLAGILKNSLEIGDNRTVEVISAPVGEQIFGPRTPRFCRTIYLYFDCLVDGLPTSIRELLQKAGDELDLHIRLRGHEYRDFRNSQQKPMAFISHDSRDKASVAKPLALALLKGYCPVWYDEFTLRPGANLREKIEQGIRECKRCILILSPNFLSNTGWTKREFEAVFTREIIKQEEILLPVWHKRF